MSHITVDLLVFEQRNRQSIGLGDLLELVGKVWSQHLIKEAFHHGGTAEPPDWSDEDDMRGPLHEALILLNKLLVLL